MRRYVSRKMQYYLFHRCNLYSLSEIFFQTSFHSLSNASNVSKIRRNSLQIPFSSLYFFTFKFSASGSFFHCSKIYIHLLVYQRDKRNIEGKGRGFTPLPPPCMEVIDEETVIATSSSDMDVSRAEQWLSPGGVVAESRKQGQKEQH